MAGTELEYYVFTTSYRDAARRGYAVDALEPAGWYLEDYQILQGTRTEGFTAEVRRHLKRSGVPVENSKGEWGLGQHELNVRYAEILEMARREGIPVVRVPLEPWGLNPLNWRASLKKTVLHLAWRVASRGGIPLRRADHFVGISLQGGRGFLRRLLAAIDHLQPGTTELMVHPGYPDGDLAGWDDYRAPRAQELAALIRPEVRERFQRGRFRLTHFGAL